MFDKLRARINAIIKKKKETIPPTDTTNSIVDSTIKSVESLLEIECPPIRSVACIFSSYIPEYDQRMILVQEELNPGEIPPDAEFSGGLSPDSTGIIMIASKYPDMNDKTSELTFIDLTEAENLFNIIHEARHVWQKEYEPDTYYQHNAVGLEAIKDPAEIDADAFALASLLNEDTPFTYLDFPSQINEICLVATLDGGKRWKRVKELSEEYGFNSEHKIKEFRANADYREINQLILMMKKNKRSKKWRA